MPDLASRQLLIVSTRDKTTRTTRKADKIDGTRYKRGHNTLKIGSGRSGGVVDEEEAFEKRRGKRARRVVKSYNQTRHGDQQYARNAS